MRHFLLALLLISVLLGCDSGGQTWQRIEQSGTLRVGLDPSYPPFETLADGELVGIDVDVMRAIGAELGLDVQFDVIGYDGLYDALLTGRVDVLASALLVDETRTKEFAYSEPYFNAGQVLVVNAGSAVDSLDDVEQVAVELGAAGHVVVTEEVRKGAEFEVVTMDSAESALNALLNERTTAALTDSVSARIFIAKHPELQIADEAVTVEPYALVVKSADGELLRQLNNALAIIFTSQQWDTILRGHLTP